VATLVLGPLAGALGCWDSCGDDPIFLRVGRLALGIAGAFALFTATVWLLLVAARRTRFAALPMAIIGLVLLVPTALAAAGMFKGTDSIGWLALCFATIGVPGVCLLVASLDIWRKGDVRSH
jgi:hypothetical protein